MPRYPKPAPGSWTEHYGLGTEQTTYEDVISPEFYELEREAVFRKAWLNVGRVDLLPRHGSYFTKELAVLGTSIVVVRDGDTVRAFHNICRHRGNKLVWSDFPQEETGGTCRQFTCKYHGWRYNLDGSLNFVQQEGEFFDLDKAKYGLVPLHCEVWEGFVFVNASEKPEQSLRDFLGPMVLGLAGYPFDKLTDRWFYRTVINSNWKIFSDATQEFYHAPVLHAGQAPAAWSVPARNAGFEAPYYQIDGPHRLVTTGGIRPWEMPPEQYKPTEGVLRAGLFGPWDSYDIGEVPAGLNPGDVHPWGNQSYQLWPNWVLLFWTQGFYYVYHYWPLAHDKMVYETSLYFPPARTARERVQQEIIALNYKDFGLQDVNTCEATQQMLESRAVERFPLGDQEVLCRHMHKLVYEAVDKYKAEKGL
jgi:glycine betaine catabolism A